MKKGNKTKEPTHYNVRISAHVYKEAKKICEKRKMLLGGFFELAALDMVIKENKREDIE